LHPGAVTLLTSQWKSGKTTLASVLLARLGSGGRLAGLGLAPGKAVVVTEEDPSLWHLRTKALGIGVHVGWCCRPFLGRPSLKTWCSFIHGLAELHERDPFSLVIVDPLAAFMPGNENSAGAIMDALLPLQRLTARKVSVLVLHHPSKGDPEIG
jgi:RecA-family ATPase